MERAKQAAREFLSSDGKHKTTIDQDVRAAVTENHIKPHEHEEVVTAVDKEVHQTHHQTRVQPVTAKEVLPEQHIHNAMPVQHKTIDHGGEAEARQHLDQEASRFRDKSTTHNTTHSTSAGATVAGERIHHHVHEHVQPVINKETIAPSVVHTTVPIHETHHAAPVVHETTVLPTKSLDEFIGSGGKTVLQGRGVQQVREFEGCPQPQAGGGDDAQRRIHGENLGSSTGGGENYGSTRHGVAGTGIAAGAAGAVAGSRHKHQHRNGRERRGSSSCSSSDEEAVARRSGRSKKSGFAGGALGTGVTGNTGAHGVGNNGTTGSTGFTGNKLSNTGSSSTTAEHKPSLLDRLNPMKDSDSDGKKGFMK